jgi:hypothetical protein
MTARLIILAAMLALSGCMTHYPQEHVHVVRQDFGSWNVNERVAHIEALKMARARVQVIDTCESACTLYVVLCPEYVCTTRHALWGFHAATQHINGSIDRGWTFQKLQEYYPASLFAWFEVNAAHLQGKDFATLTGVQMIAKGWAGEC